MALDKVPTRIEPAGSAEGAAEEAPRAQVAEEAGSAAGSSAQAGAPSGAAASGATERSGAAGGQGSAHVAGEGAFAAASRWLAETFPNSRHAVLGGLCGLLVAILLFTIGLIKTLVVVVLVLAGVAAGQFLDGDPKIARALQSLLRQH